MTSLFQTVLNSLLRIFKLTLSLTKLASVSAIIPDSHDTWYSFQFYSLGKPVFACERVDARWGKLECEQKACEVIGSTTIFGKI